MEVLVNTLATSTLPTASTGLAAATPSDAERFAQLMQAAPTSAGPVPEATQARAAAPTAPATPVATGADVPVQNVGERILSGMQNISQDMKQKWSVVSQTLQDGGNNLTMQDMLRLQLHLTQASVQYEVLGKAISKSTQNFDQLVRVQ